MKELGLLTLPIASFFSRSICCVWPYFLHFQGAVLPHPVCSNFTSRVQYSHIWMQYFHIKVQYFHIWVQYMKKYCTQMWKFCTWMWKYCSRDVEVLHLDVEVLHLGRGSTAHQMARDAPDRHRRRILIK